MTYFHSHQTTEATPEQLLEVLTDPDAIRSWSPVPFDVERLEGPRLEAGSHARVTGSLAGMRVGFDVEVHAADEDGIELTADGPIGFDVLYELVEGESGSELSASIGVRRSGGLTGRVLERAAGALLSAGALDSAAGRIARAAEAVRPMALAA